MGYHRKMQSENIKEWMQEIEVLQNELREREQSLPAHSIHPSQLLVIEELEQKIHSLRGKIEDGGENPQERP